MRQQVQASSNSFTKVFPLAVHLGDKLGHQANVTFHKMSYYQIIKGGGPKCDRQGKNFFKASNLTLAVRFLTSDTYLLSHSERFGMSEIRAISH